VKKGPLTHGDFADDVPAWPGMALGAWILATFDRTGFGVLAVVGLRAVEPETRLSEL